MVHGTTDFMVQMVEGGERVEGGGGGGGCDGGGGGGGGGGGCD